MDWREVEVGLFFGSGRTLQLWQSLIRNKSGRIGTSAQPQSWIASHPVQCQWSSWKKPAKRKSVITVCQTTFWGCKKREIQIVQTHFKVVLKETGQGFGMPGGSEDCLESRIGFALRRVTKFTSSHVHLIESSLIQTYVCVHRYYIRLYIYTYYVCTKWYRSTCAFEGTYLADLRCSCDQSVTTCP